MYVGYKYGTDPTVPMLVVFGIRESCIDDEHKKDLILMEMNDMSESGTKTY